MITDEAARDIRFALDFAYRNGLHEFGYDPLETLLTTLQSKPADEETPMTEDQIKHMANRFLSWKLPADFHPDNGISAVRPNYGPDVKWEPIGTNLLTATQAEQMVRYMLEGLTTDKGASE